MSDVKKTFNRLKSKKAIGVLFNKGKAGRCGCVLVKAVAGELDPKVAIIAPKKTGNAVKRNRIKRRLRAAVNEMVEALPKANIAVIAQARATDIPFVELVKNVKKAIEKATETEL